MSKPPSNHFHGTTGDQRFNDSLQQTEGDIINQRVQGLDLREHPVEHKSTLSIKEIKNKVRDRTASRDDYKKLESEKKIG